MPHVQRHTCRHTQHCFHRRPLAPVHPQLTKTIQEIHCVRVHCRSAREEVFGNFAMSARGSIRKAPNVMTWYYSLESLRTKHNEQDAGLVVREWNKVASLQNQLRGAKAQCVKNLLELPKKASELLLTSTLKHGWALRLAEHTLRRPPRMQNADFRMQDLPGHVPKLTPKEKFQNATLLNTGKF